MGYSPLPCSFLLSLASTHQLEPSTLNRVGLKLYVSVRILILPPPSRFHYQSLIPGHCSRVVLPGISYYEGPVRAESRFPVLLLGIPAWCSFPGYLARRHVAACWHFRSFSF